MSKYHNDYTANSFYTLFAISHQKGLRWKMDFHTHLYYEVFIFHGGECKYLIGNQMYELESGDIIVMDGRQLHKPILTGDPDNYDRSIVEFSCDWILPLLEYMDLAFLLKPFQLNHHTVYKTENNRQFVEIENYVQKLETITKSSLSIEERNKRLKIKLIDFLFLIWDLKPFKVKKTENLTDEKALYIQAVLDFIEENYRRKITLQEIADHVNLSKSYIVHLFKEQTGFTIMEYIMQYRLIQSMHLLNMNPEMPIKEVAYICGFESSAHYSRFFKENVGLPPKKYRITVHDLKE